MRERQGKLVSTRSNEKWDKFWAGKERQWAKMASEVTVIRPDQTREDVAEELKEKEERHKARLQEDRKNAGKKVAKSRKPFRSVRRPR